MPAGAPSSSRRGEAKQGGASAAIVAAACLRHGLPRRRLLAIVTSASSATTRVGDPQYMLGAPLLAAPLRQGIVTAALASCSGRRSAAA